MENRSIRTGADGGRFVSTFRCRQSACDPHYLYCRACLRDLDAPFTIALICQINTFMQRR